MKMEFYDDDEADKLATQFFKYYYHDRGKMKWGKQMLVPFRGSIKDTLLEMQEDLQSSISYAGGRDLKSITKVDYVVVKNSILNGDY